MREMTNTVEQDWESSQLYPRPDCGGVNQLPMVSEFQAWPPRESFGLGLDLR